MLLYYQNVNRIRSKTIDFFLSNLNCNFDVICLTETNLNSGVFDNEILDSRYNVFRRDRDSTSVLKKDGGGILVGVKKYYNVVRQYSWESRFEDIWLSIKQNNSLTPNVHLCLCYLYPSMPKVDLCSFYDKLQNVILKLNDNDLVVVMGDFNVPSVSWSVATDGKVVYERSTNDYRSMYLLETMTLCKLAQFNYILNKNNRILDLIFSTSQNNISCKESLPIIRIDGHHPPLLIEISSAHKVRCIKQAQKGRINYNKADSIQIIRELVEIDWTDVLAGLDVDAGIDLFYDKLNSIVTANAPLLSARSRRFPHWFSPSLVKCLNRKNKYHNKFKKFRNPLDYQEYSYLRSECKKLIRECYDTFVANTEMGLKDNIRVFWRFVNSRKVANLYRRL